MLAKTELRRKREFMLRPSSWPTVSVDDECIQALKHQIETQGYISPDELYVSSDRWDY